MINKKIRNVRYLLKIAFKIFQFAHPWLCSTSVVIMSNLIGDWRNFVVTLREYTLQLYLGIYEYTYNKYSARLQLTLDIGVDAITFCSLTRLLIHIKH